MALLTNHKRVVLSFLEKSECLSLFFVSITQYRFYHSNAGFFRTTVGRSFVVR
jgi:hypothetical protein